MELLIPLLIWLFAITHVDTFVLLVAFCTDPEYRLPEIAIGHAIGFTVGLTIAVGSALIVGDRFEQWAFMLGVVPLGLGLWALDRGQISEEVGEPPFVRTSIGRIGTVTGAGIGVTGENVAVYVPVFVRLTIDELLVVVFLFLGGAAMVLVLAVLTGRRLATVDIPRWIESGLVPGTLIIVGCYVILAGVFVH